MISAIFQWIVVWLWLSIMIGPLFLALMSITLTEWKKKAYWFIVGNSLSDILIAFLTYKWLILWRQWDWWPSRIVWVIWAIVFCVYWIMLLLKKETPKDIEINTHTSMWHIGNLTVAAKWFFMNLVNPSIFVFWVTVLSHFIRRHQEHISPEIIWVFLASILVTFIIADILKVHSAHWILKKLTVKTLDKVHNIAGVLLIIAGIIILVRIVM